MIRQASMLVLLFSLLVASAATAETESVLPPGWAGADLASAQSLAASSRRPILIFVRRKSCPPCDRIEQWLTSDDQITPLTEPYIRLRLSLDEVEGQAAATLLKVPSAPTILILGPDGMEATRQAITISKSWLVELLQITIRRHQPDTDLAPPTPNALRASQKHLLLWGDLQGSDQIEERLALANKKLHPARQSGMVAESDLEIDTPTDLTDRLANIDDPTDLRRETHVLALQLEQEGRAGLSLAAYRYTVDRLTVAPLSAARAAFLAERQNLPLELHLQWLAEAREISPSSLPVLMAQARLAERTGRIYMAYHAVEAAMVYAPDDAWIRLEHYRLRLLVRLRSRSLERDPT
jgi:hypothetical protein